MGWLADEYFTDYNRRYRKLALKYHPDQSKDAAAAQKFAEVGSTNMLLL